MYGKFIVENDRIIGVEANNIQLANKILIGSTKHTHKCDVCEYNTVCMRGCLGSQYENTQDPLIPCDTVCDLFKTKINYLLYRYQKEGLLDILAKNANQMTNTPTLHFYNYLKRLQEGEEYNQWLNSRK